MIALPDAAPGGTYEGCGGALGRLNGFLRISQRFLFFFFFFFFPRILYYVCMRCLGLGERHSVWTEGVAM